MLLVYGYLIRYRIGGTKYCTLIAGSKWYKLAKKSPLKSIWAGFDGNKRVIHISFLYKNFWLIRNFHSLDSRKRT